MPPKRVLLVLAVSLGTAPALADHDVVYFISGTTCQPGYGASQLAYGEPGVSNFSVRSSARVFCPVDHAVDPDQEPLAGPLGPTMEVTRTRVRTGILRYFDGTSASAERGGEFWCYMWATSWTGAQRWTPRRYTCTDGGCTDSTTEYVGGFEMQWVEPFGNIEFNNATFGFSCKIPPQGTAASWVSSMTLRAVQP